MDCLDSSLTVHTFLLGTNCIKLNLLKKIFRFKFSYNTYEALLSVQNNLFYKYQFKIYQVPSYVFLKIQITVSKISDLNIGYFWENQKNNVKFILN